MNFYNKGDSQQVSKINEAGFQIQRLHNYWLLAENNANQGQLEKWKFRLDTIWRELAADVERGEDTVKRKEQNRELVSNIINSESKATKYQALQERHMFLKMIQDKSGKGALWYDPESDGDML